MPGTPRAPPNKKGKGKAPAPKFAPQPAPSASTHKASQSVSQDPSADAFEGLTHFFSQAQEPSASSPPPPASVKSPAPSSASLPVTAPATFTLSTPHSKPFIDALPRNKTGSIDLDVYVMFVKDTSLSKTALRNSTPYTLRVEMNDKDKYPFLSIDKVQTGSSGPVHTSWLTMDARPVKPIDDKIVVPSGGIVDFAAHFVWRSGCGVAVTPRSRFLTFPFGPE